MELTRSSADSTAAIIKRLFIEPDEGLARSDPAAP